MNIRMIVTTCRPEDAEKIAEKMLEEKLISSCNIIPGLTTKVRFEGEILTQAETMLVMRTRSDLISTLEEVMMEYNSFSIPEVASLEVKEWNDSYLNWILQSTRENVEF